MDCISVMEDQVIIHVLGYLAAHFVNWPPQPAKSHVLVEDNYPSSDTGLVVNGSGNVGRGGNGGVIMVDNASKNGAGNPTGLTYAISDVLSSIVSTLNPAGVEPEGVARRAARLSAVWQHHARTRRSTSDKSGDGSSRVQDEIIWDLLNDWMVMEQRLAMPADDPHRVISTNIADHVLVDGLRQQDETNGNQHNMARMMVSDYLIPPVMDARYEELVGLPPVQFPAPNSKMIQVMAWDVKPEQPERHQNPAEVLENPETNDIPPPDLVAEDWNDVMIGLDERIVLTTDDLPEGVTLEPEGWRWSRRLEPTIRLSLPGNMSEFILTPQQPFPDVLSYRGPPIDNVDNMANADTLQCQCRCPTPVQSTESNEPPFQITESTPLTEFTLTAQSADPSGEFTTETPPEFFLSTESYTESFSQSTTESVTEFITESFTEFMTESTTEPTTEPTSEPTTEPTTESTTESTTDFDPDFDPESASESVTESTTVPTTEFSLEYATGPTLSTKLSTEPTTLTESTHAMQFMDDATESPETTGSPETLVIPENIETAMSEATAKDAVVVTTVATTSVATPSHTVRPIPPILILEGEPVRYLIYHQLLYDCWSSPGAIIHFVWFFSSRCSPQGFSS